MKTYWKATAALVIGAGLYLAVALQQAGEELKIDCAAYDKEMWRLGDESQWDTIYVKAIGSPKIPVAAGDAVLGDCVDGVCRVHRQDCKAEVSYKYSPGKTVDDATTFEVRAPLAFLAGWRRWADDSHGEAEYQGSLGQVFAECSKSTAAEKCVQMLPGECFLLDTGDICRYGWLVRVRTPGDSPPLPCPTARIIAPFPCTTMRGADSEWETVAKEITKEDMDAATTAVVAVVSPK
jgi:hypothetical protein